MTNDRTNESTFFGDAPTIRSTTPAKHRSTTPAKHRQGYNRPKTTWDWGWQILFAVLAVASLFGGATAVLSVFFILNILWVEWMARCEDRKRVHRAIAVIWGLVALMTVRNNRYEAGVAARKVTHPPSPNGPGPNGKWNALDYGDR